MGLRDRIKLKGRKLLSLAHGDTHDRAHRNMGEDMSLKQPWKVKRMQKRPQRIKRQYIRGESVRFALYTQTCVILFKQCAEHAAGFLLFSFLLCASR